MSFYDEIADYYDDIFPLHKTQVDFVKGCVEAPFHGKKVLDVGCGTGDLAVTLSEADFAVTAIDSDKEMIHRADGKTRTGRHVTFVRMNMSEVSSFFAPSSFDAVLCFGNTLVHLDGPREIEGFLRQARAILKKGCPLLLQILNYDHVLDHHVRELPLIETDRIRFDRHYEYLPDKDRIVFRTLLLAKPLGKTIENEILLYPVRRRNLEEALRKSGFTDISFYGDFTKGELTPGSLPLVAEAR